MDKEDDPASLKCQSASTSEGSLDLLHDLPTSMWSAASKAKAKPAPPASLFAASTVPVIALPSRDTR
jgi:hypothetical protein